MKIRFVTIALLISSLSLMSCGEKKDRGKNLEMGLTGNPSIIPIESSSCTDKAKAKEDGTIAAEKSLAAPSAVFSALELRWSDTQRSLEVVRIRITIRGTNIADGEQKIDLDGTELEALLASAERKIAPATSDSAPTVVNSSDAVTRAATDYAACGFGIGGIALVDEDRLFTATVTIELTGAAIDTNGFGETVKKSFTTTLRYD